MKSPEYQCHSFDPGSIVTSPTLLVSQFPQINTIIDNALSNNVGVLVFCESGNDKSATVTAAYIVHCLKMNHIAAIQFVQSKRFSICLDDFSKYNLQTFEGLAGAQTTGFSGANHVKKPRMLENDEDEEIRDSIDGTRKRVFDGFAV
jgi:hypothetical protein